MVTLMCNSKSFALKIGKKKQPWIVLLKKLNDNEHPQAAKACDIVYRNVSICWKMSQQSFLFPYRNGIVDGTRCVLAKLGRNIAGGPSVFNEEGRFFLFFVL